ncbi:MAG: histidinol phosphate phosphatase [Verrucomicrobiales bacterium]
MASTTGELRLSEFPKYLDLVGEARDRFPDLPIRLGLEVDFLEGGEAWIERLAAMADFDYLIGSVHYIAPGWDVDNPRWIGDFRDRPVEESGTFTLPPTAKRSAADSSTSWRTPISPKSLDFARRATCRYYDPVVQAAADSRRGGRDQHGMHKECAELYPAQPFVELLPPSAGVPVVISSDAHAPGEVERDFDLAVAAARRRDIRACRFEKRQRLPCRCRGARYQAMARISGRNTLIWSGSVRLGVVQ